MEKWFRRMNKFYGFGIIILVALILIVLFVTRLTKPYTYTGSVFTPPQAAPDFSAHDASGKAYRLSSEKGKIVLLFFGYTSCTDECPTTMTVLKQVEAGLGKNGDRVDFVFITIDPARDSPPVLQSFVDKFDPTFIGIPGAESELQPIWQSYGVYIEKTIDAAAKGYTLAHTNRIYLVDTSGNLRLTYPYGTSAADILKDVQHLLE